MEVPINKRLEILLNHYKMSQKQLAIKAGLSENTISNAKKGKNIPGVEFFNCIYLAFPDINPKWLYLGIGKMLLDDTQPIAIESSEKKMVSNFEKKIIALQKEIQYLKIQIRDKEEIINLLKKN